MRAGFLLLPLAASCFALAAAAQSPVVVEAVQYPAWLERGGHAAPLTPGTTLQSQDTIRTGGNARVQLRLAEGSTVKLGEKARFQVEKIENRGIFRAALKVLEGAFRFTTDAAGKKRTRDVTVQVKNVTAGIRGTDLWGKSTDERDLVCLLEGSISVGAQGHPTVTLDKPLDFYQKPRDGAPEVAKVDEARVREWAAETEISSQGAAAKAGGKWRVVAAAKLPSRDAARALRRTLRAEGYPAEITGGDGRFAVQVSGLAGEEEARALMGNLRQIKGVSMPQVLPSAP